MIAVTGSDARARRHAVAAEVVCFACAALVLVAMAAGSAIPEASYVMTGFVSCSVTTHLLFAVGGDGA